MRRSSRIRTPSRRFLEHFQTRDIALPAAFESARYDPHIPPETETQSAFCLLAKAMDKDTMCHHQALKQPDRAEFLAAMQDEIKSHDTCEHWKLIRRAAVPTGHRILSTVWSLKRKCRI